MKKGTMLEIQQCCTGSSPERYIQAKTLLLLTFASEKLAGQAVFAPPQFVESEQSLQ